MPFEKIIPRPFTSNGVKTYAPSVSGVYGISNASEWIYIGETRDIQGALLDHLRNQEDALMKRHPAGFVFEVCDEARRFGRQDRLVGEYEPTCQRASSPRR